MDIARRIQSLLDEHDYTQLRFASEIGLSQPFVSQILNGKKKASLETIEQICSFFSITLHDFFIDTSIDANSVPPYVKAFYHYCSDMSYDEIQSLRAVAEFFPSKRRRISGQRSIVPIRVPGRAAAGLPLFEETDDEVIAPEKYRDESRYLIIEAKGDSMEPRIKDGDYVVVARSVTPISGEISLVCIDGPSGREYTIKLFYDTPEGFELRSINTEYQPLKYSEMQVISAERVVHIIKK